MKTFNLAQALKQKNRLAGEVARGREIVQRENSRKESQTPRADVRVVFEKSVTQSRELAAFKGAIAAANAGVVTGDHGIYGKLNLQAELRGLITFLKGLNTKEGEEIERVGFLSRDEASRTVYVAAITRDEVDRLVATYQAEIEQLQDEIDEFNATTRITLSA
ncbi:MAG: hypothetical protein HY736_06230 [Verrucomicrobia bacterium]|nr:hypothetical protein [Verrucomicrobiota bacterium]